MPPTSRGADAPDTIVLIHGLWMTPRCWEAWAPHYRAKGFTVLTPAYPGLEVEVEALRADPAPIAALTMPATVEHLARVIGGLDRPPIIMGHSFGGLFTQLLLDRGLGAAGVGINSVPVEGVPFLPPSQIRSLFPLLTDPIHRSKPLPFTPEQFHYAFTNTLGPAAAAAVYDRYTIAAPGPFVWSGVLAKLPPGHRDTWVDVRNGGRAPLLLIAGGADHIMPASVNRANADLYRHADAVTDYHEFPGRSHYTIGEPGWEAVADYALDWALDHARTAARTDSSARAD